ncbi:zf-RVT domain-containing protein, partial [Cephalotus follicularis]
FSFKAAWQSISSRLPGTPWAKIVWFSGAIPKHSFCLWLTFHNAHLTLDKLHLFGIVQNTICPFGCGQQETLDHLFFECPFTKAVWSKVLELNNFALLADWNWHGTASWALGRTAGRP